MGEDEKQCSRCGRVYETYAEYLNHGAYACMNVWRSRALTVERENERLQREMEEVKAKLADARKWVNYYRTLVSF